MLLWIQAESLNQDFVRFSHRHLVNVLQMPLHAAKVGKLLITKHTRLLGVICSPPLLVNFSHVSFHFLLRLERFAAGFAIGGLLSVRLHVTV